MRGMRARTREHPGTRALLPQGKRPRDLDSMTTYACETGEGWNGKGRDSGSTRLTCNNTAFCDSLLRSVQCSARCVLVQPAA